MDREVIEEKLESLRRCIHRVREKRPVELDALVRNFDLQDIITLNLTRAVQLCVDIGTRHSESLSKFSRRKRCTSSHAQGGRSCSTSNSRLKPDDAQTRCRVAGHSGLSTEHCFHD